MSGPNVITLDPNRRVRRRFPDQTTVAILVFLIFDAMILAGMVGAFILTRAAAGDAWPPAGQPWFSPQVTAINTAALLVSGSLVLLAARARQNRKNRVGPLLLAAIVLGMVFIFVQGALWIDLIRQGSTLSSSQHGSLFCLIVATHGAHAIGAVVFLGIVWLGLRPLRSEDPEPRRSLPDSRFRAACLLWYFTVGIWPVLYLCLYR